jgi:EAL domain-containing protein (putative c-di-GMP-specific phosphodiesterase class I)/GGDEF domain-containing protein
MLAGRQAECPAAGASTPSNQAPQRGISKQTMNETIEAARLDALRHLDLLDTEPGEAFDRITRMAAQLFSLPSAAMSLTDADRQWFKSRVGIGPASMPRFDAPCALVTESGDALVIHDLLDHPRYRDSTTARCGIRFYAGVPLTTAAGFALGTLCVMGPEPRRTAPSELAALHDLAAMVMSQIELQHAAGRIDPHSGLPNRNQFIEDYHDMERNRPRGERRLAVMINLAAPEQLSNALRVMGSAYLDSIVSEAARSLRAEMGPKRKVYQLAPTQFVLIASPGEVEESYFPKLLNWLAARNASAMARFVTTPAIGVAPFAMGEVECQDVLRMAHSAGQDAFHTANRLSTYSPAQDSAYQRRFTLLNAFGSALEQSGQLRLVYQPRMDLGTGMCIGAEALLRWTHPELGIVSPGEFMPIVEQTLMARPTTAWVIETALRQLALWRDAGVALQLSVNVSAPNLLEADFAQRVAQGLAEHGLEPHRLELEITESTIMEHPEMAHATLDALAAAGIRLAIDDFGTGYSSLSYLQSIPADVVKIDQSFMRQLVDDERKRSLVSAMVTLSHDLNYRVVAEGVETVEVLSFLKAAGCDEAQGYLFGRPMSAEDLTAFCHANAASIVLGGPAS